MQYLTSIVSSGLQWITDDERKEQIWDLASQRLSERAGRTATPSRTRTYPIYRRNRSWVAEEKWQIQLHEPTLTEDNLGLKTWIASHILAQKIANLAPPTLEPAEYPNFGRAHNSNRSVLELGAGTGLAGITAALDLRTTVWCTDLPDIVPNLERNVAANADSLKERNAEVRCGVLDWNDPRRIKVPGTDTEMEVEDSDSKFRIVLAADVLYEPQHPEQVASVVSLWLQRTPDARFLAALPKRPSSEKDWNVFKKALVNRGLSLTDEGEDIGYEDWFIYEDEAPAEVTIWWSSWAWDPSVLSTSRRDKCMPQ